MRAFDEKSDRSTNSVIDYRMARRAVLQGIRRGSLSVWDSCDAHPELVRAGRNIGRRMVAPCPVCSGDGLRLVRYVFGDQLRHLSGRPVYPDDWVKELVKSYDEFRCYAIEVCIDCGWNHLLASYLLGRRYAPSGRRPSPRRRAEVRRSSVLP